MDFNFKDRYDINDVLRIMRVLRSEDGCPWDKVQTHKSIRDNFIEETYEVVEAIDNEDFPNLREELGDVLLQVVFHSQMSEDEGKFTFDDVCDELVKKLVNRHPHVFGDVKAKDAGAALDTWEKTKMKLKEQKTGSETVNDVPKALPSLVRCQKMQKRASKAGMDFKDLNEVIERTYEELDELKEAVSKGDADGQYEELGDLLFSVVNISRFLKVDSEHALYDANEKFADRFGRVEKRCIEQGIDMKTADSSLIDSLWEDIKYTT